MSDPIAIAYFPRRRFKEKTCKLCGDVFTPRSGKQKFCSHTCAKIAERKKRGSQPVGIGAECKECKKLFVTTSGGQKYCSVVCREDFHRRKKRIQARVGKNSRPLGIDITCRICGARIERTGPHTMFCKERCKPDGHIQCARCGEAKDYNSYYDFRPHGRFRRTCKDCISKYYQEKKRFKILENL